jgi:hypothetical protein
MTPQAAPGTAAATSASPVKKPSRQVITISPSGQISGLQVKPGKGVDLRQFGKAQIERASEIVWDDDHQRWFVQITRGQYAGKIIGHDFCEEVGFKRHGIDVNYYCGAPDNRLVVQDYDEAVRLEIMVLDHIRITQGPDAL